MCKPDDPNFRQLILQRLEVHAQAQKIRDFIYTKSDDSSSSDDDQSINGSDLSSSSSDSSDSDNEFVPSVPLARALISSQRYLAPRKAVRKNTFAMEGLFELDDKRFRQDIRMSKVAFFSLLHRLQEHPVFQNNSLCPQSPVKLQLAVALYRFGSFGSSASLGKIARHFGISEGSVHLYTERSLVAILSLEEALVRWYSDEEKKEIKRRIKETSGFPNCVGYVDGTLAVFGMKPTLNGEDYHSRKSRYGLSVLIVCDDDRRIRYIFTGFCGSVHDNRVFKESKLGRQPHRFLQNGEYFLADSGYRTTETVVASFKKPAANLSENSRFNRRLAGERIPIEHCNGIFKGRFPCLRGLPLKIKTGADHRRAIYWIRQQIEILAWRITTKLDGTSEN
ncbi:hypothetical protein BV898_03052 [Hypsibius exemplaris]|uniref:DDE Tnp4 domain-containing protein n=1 Tax=Hypsibius exemplaris TaxID=2072580 RepID=A0A1W0X6Q8_HYPEX|nr:hypothetical protein BV898_03052 [Hypsibius exemplaris]